MAWRSSSARVMSSSFVRRFRSAGSRIDLSSMGGLVPAGPQAPADPIRRRARLRAFGRGFACLQGIGRGSAGQAAAGGELVQCLSAGLRFEKLGSCSLRLTALPLTVPRVGGGVGQGRGKERVMCRADQVAGGQRQRSARGVDPEVVGGDHDGEQREPGVGRERIFQGRAARPGAGRGSTTSTTQSEGSASRRIGWRSTASCPNRTTRARRSGCSVSTKLELAQPPYSPHTLSSRGGISGYRLNPIRANAGRDGQGIAPLPVALGHPVEQVDQRGDGHDEVERPVEDVPEPHEPRPAEEPALYGLRGYCPTARSRSMMRSALSSA